MKIVVKKDVVIFENTNGKKIEILHDDVLLAASLIKEYMKKQVSSVEMINSEIFEVRTIEKKKNT